MKKNTYLIPLVLILAYIFLLYTGFFKDFSTKIFVILSIIAISVAFLIKKYKNGMLKKQNIILFLIAVIFTFLTFFIFEKKI